MHMSSVVPAHHHGNVNFFQCLSTPQPEHAGCWCHGNLCFAEVSACIQLWMLYTVRIMLETQGCSHFFQPRNEFSCSLFGRLCCLAFITCLCCLAFITCFHCYHNPTGGVTWNEAICIVDRLLGNAWR